jgi:hypothetical protein
VGFGEDRRAVPGDNDGARERVCGRELLELGAQRRKRIRFAQPCGSELLLKAKDQRGGEQLIASLPDSVPALAAVAYGSYAA